MRRSDYINDDDLILQTPASSLDFLTTDTIPFDKKAQILTQEKKVIEYLADEDYFFDSNYYFATPSNLRSAGFYSHEGASAVLQQQARSHIKPPSKISKQQKSIVTSSFAPVATVNTDELVDTLFSFSSTEETSNIATVSVHSTSSAAPLLHSSLLDDLSTINSNILPELTEIKSIHEVAVGGGDVVSSTSAVITLKASETLLCIQRGSTLAIERFEIRGEVNIGCCLRGGSNNRNGGTQVQGSAKDDEPSPPLATMVEVGLAFSDPALQLCNVNANKMFATPVRAEAEVYRHIQLKLPSTHQPEQELQKNKNLSAILKYNVLPSFQPCILRAKSTVAFKGSVAHLIVQVELNKHFKISMRGLDVQVSLAALEKATSVKDVRTKPSGGTFDPASKNRILSWVMRDVCAEDFPLHLEAQISMASSVLSAPDEAVAEVATPKVSLPLIVKASYSDNLVSSGSLKITSAEFASEDREKEKEKNSLAPLTLLANALPFEVALLCNTTFEYRFL